MNRYDPETAPDPAEWEALDEMERIDLVERYHRRKRVKLPNATAHAVFHVVVENQAALGDELNVAATLERLMAEGLSRHDALHAIGTVLSSHMYDVMGDERPEFSRDAYAADLDALTSEKWLAMGEEEE